MNKVVGVTLPVYLLCRELETLEERLNFSVFYCFAEILQSHHFCPGFEFNGVYYEVQYSDKNELNVLKFNTDALIGEYGDVLSGDDIMNLVEELRQI